MYVVILVKICAYSLDMLSLQASGILTDKTMDVKLIYIPNVDKQNKKKIEKFWHYLFGTNQ